MKAAIVSADGQWLVEEAINSLKSAILAGVIGT